MPKTLSISFTKPGGKAAATVIAFAGPDLQLGPQAKGLDLDETVAKAAAAANFKGAVRSRLEILAPAAAGIDKLVVIGTGEAEKLSELDWVKLGGVAVAAAGSSKAVSVLAETPDGSDLAPARVADLAQGMLLGAYRFDKFKSDKDDDAPKKLTVKIACEGATAVRKAWGAAEAIAAGVVTARNLVNEPANELGPVEFADRAAELKKLGVSVEILGEKELKKLEMRALLGVSQGSRRPPRVAVMRWNGGKAKKAPVAFIGKGVVFDTGGISIKPSGGMEDMKGDMAGAAAVVGTMQALAGRKAKVNAIGIIGLVENMPDGNAQRPGDIVKSKAGKTIEIVNTDAEGRLVLCDLLTYVQEVYKPQMMIDLATLTGAIIIALGHHHAGIYATDDALAEGLSEAGEATGEAVWRMPLGTAYDKMINSRFADVKNVGGRAAGSITAAQFLKRFVDDTPWAHIDLAGTAMASPKSEINQSWASGWGVRLLDRLVSDRYES